MNEASAAGFSEPSLALVEHAFRELGYEERLSGFKMGASVGNTPTDLYSLKDAVVFLVGTRWDAVTNDNHKATLNWVDISKLVTWLRDAVGDTELAEAIERDVSESAPYKMQSDKIAELVVERMQQYQAVLDAAENDHSDSERGDSAAGSSATRADAQEATITVQ